MVCGREDTLRKLFREAMYPLSTVGMVLRGCEEEMEEEVIGHGFSGFERAGSVVVALGGYLGGWRQARLVKSYACAGVYHELCVVGLWLACEWGWKLTLRNDMEVGFKKDQRS